MTGAGGDRRLLVLATEACMGSALMDEVRDRAEGAEVIVVAPALATRLRYWLSDEDPGVAAAERRQQASLEHVGAAGVPAHGVVGDPDPLQALDDAVRTYAPDEVVIVTHPDEQANWLEHGLVAQARDRLGVPVTHLVADDRRGDSRLVTHERPARDAPARERHTTRDIALVALAGVLALLGTVLSFLFLAAGVSDAMWALVLAFDLGLKLVAVGIVWVLFQRRARADRLDL